MELGLKKLYYSISEVSRSTGVEQHTLRYWESEFPQLKPAKNRAGNRIYTYQDINLILKIKELLKDKKYTFEGARRVLEEEKAQNSSNQKQRKKSLAKSLLKEDNELPLRKKAERKIIAKNKLSIEKDLLAIKDFLLFLRSKID